MEYKHVPVMLEEAIEYLNLKPGQIIVDCTLGGGGYTREIAKKVGSTGKVIAIDADEMAITNYKLQITNDLPADATALQAGGLKNIILINDNFLNLHKILKENGIDSVDGVVFDLGLSSAQLEDRSRGFSFRMDAPLTMELGIKNQELFNIKTEDIVNKYKVEDLEKIIREYGEEKYAGRIAKTIVKNRPLSTTKQLAEIIKNAVPSKYAKGKIHPATRTFQALRIATNNELENLEMVLPQAVDVLKKDGRLVVVSFHSLEDRIVKIFFRQETKECICPPQRILCDCEHTAKVKILTKKPVVPSVDEIKNNPRARSAKLRAIEKI